MRLALRRLLRARAFSITATLTVALGIAGAAGVFTVIDSVLLRPLPYPHPEQLVDLTHTLSVAGLTRVDESDATFLLYRRDNHSFSDIGAYRSAQVNVVPDAHSGTAQPERLSAAFASASLLPVLGITPALGRAFAADEDRPGATPVVVVSHAFWQRAFGGDAGVLDRTIVVDGIARRVVGVMPETFQFPDASIALWLPLQLNPDRTKSAAFDYHAVGRLRPGVSLASATADLAAILPRLPQVFPGRLTSAGITSVGLKPSVRPLRDVTVGNLGRVLWTVLGALVTLLLIALANVTNLFLARVEGRTHELVLRKALGADRRALLSDLLSESVWIVGAGAALGLAAAAAGLGVFTSLPVAGTIPRIGEVHLDLWTVGAAVAAVIVTGACLGLLALARVPRDLSNALLASRSVSSARVRHLTRRGLVVAQVTLAVMLAYGAGVMARSFARLRSVDPGFTPAGALSFRVALPTSAYRTAGDADRVVSRLLDRIRAISSVKAAGVVTKLPLDPEAAQDSAVFIEDHPLQPNQLPAIDQISFASPEYFAAMRIPLLAGRGFTPATTIGEPPAVPPEAIVSAAFAERYWGSAAQAIGKHIRTFPGDPWRTIVGVARGVHEKSLEADVADEVYTPLVTRDATGTPYMPRDVAIVVRTAGVSSSVYAELRRAVADADPSLPIYRPLPLEQLVAGAASKTMFTLIALVAASLVATIIGAVGIYGVIAYLVSLRTRDIGVRIALGAEPAHVRRLITRQAVTDAGIGVALGVAGSLAASRALGALTFGVGPRDLVSLLAAGALLFAAALLASWIPARRAAALDPTVALRSE